MTEFCVDPTVSHSDVTDTPVPALPERHAISSGLSRLALPPEIRGKTGSRRRDGKIRGKRGEGVSVDSSNLIGDTNHSSNRDRTLTTMGAGQLVSVRASDGCQIIELDWTLAGGAKAIMYRFQFK